MYLKGSHQILDGLFYTNDYEKISSQSTGDNMDKRARILTSWLHQKPADLDFHCLTLYSIMTPLKYHIFENILENGAFVPKEQMLHFP